MTETDLAYLAGVLDTMGRISVRKLPNGTKIPQVAVHTKDMRLLRWLGEITETTPFLTRREYSKAGCNEHCKEKHQHVISESGRWSVSGIKATVMLANSVYYMKLSAPEAELGIRVGKEAPFKRGVLNKMEDLGWDITVMEDA